LPIYEQLLIKVFILVFSCSPEVFLELKQQRVRATREAKEKVKQTRGSLSVLMLADQSADLFADRSADMDLQISDFPL
jgi:hypothetical protein